MGLLAKKSEYSKNFDAVVVSSKKKKKNEQEKENKKKNISVDIVWEFNVSIDETRQGLLLKLFEEIRLSPKTTNNYNNVLILVSTICNFLYLLFGGVVSMGKDRK